MIYARYALPGASTSRASLDILSATSSMMPSSHPEWPLAPDMKPTKTQRLGYLPGGVIDDVYQAANDEYVSRGRNPVWKEYPWKQETTNLVVGEWIRLCVCASIDKTKRWWTPDHPYHYEAEKNYLLKTIDNILAEIRKKGAPN